MEVPDQIDAHLLREIVAVFRDAVHRHAGRLNLLNVYPVPDGDTGTNMARTLDAVIQEVEAATPDLESTCDAISHGSLMGARGNSGVILSQILRGIATTFRTGLEHGGSATTSGAARLAEALTAASAGAYQAVLTPVEGTILTVVREAAEGARGAVERGEALAQTAQHAYRSAADALQRTPELLPVLKQAGVVDAGGAGFLLFLDAALHVLTGREMPVPDVPAEAAEPVAAAVAGSSASPGSIEAHGTAAGGPRYEVMYFCHLPDEHIDELKQRWGAIGDSIVVVGGDGFWNCHVHTDDIGGAIEAALDLGGRPSRIRVSDLHEEVEQEHRARELAMTPERVPCAVVAVSSGDGLSELFEGLGVRRVVGGGQSDNPSTAELLEAVEASAADAVIILPNNKNIIPVAQQVVELASVPVHVVPTVSMVEGLSALVHLDPTGDAATLADEMRETAAAVATGELTCAVRDSGSVVGPITAGDWIGLVRGDGIVAAGQDPIAVACQLLAQLLGEDRELLTVLVGADADDAVEQGILAWLGETHPDIEVEVHRGGQPLYPFIFGAE